MKMNDTDAGKNPERLHGRGGGNNVGTHGGGGGALSKGDRAKAKHNQNKKNMLRTERSLQGVSYK